MTRKIFLRLTDALLIAVLITALASTDWADEFDYIFSDRFYQHGGEKSSEIIVVGIDRETLNNLGPRESITRRDIAKVIDYLNRDPNARPAVIGFDALFTGENSSDPEGDKILVDAAAKFGNVVVGSEADIDDKIFPRNNTFTPWEKTWPMISPFPALNSVVDTGHINAPNEIDGVTRHDLLFVNVEERGQLFSFARVIYEKFCRVKGIEPKAPPSTERNGIFYLLFTAKSYSGKINFFDLLEGRDTPPVEFHDKIILIGPYAPGMQDDTTTALDRSDWMYGVDVHANAIQAFMTGDLPREVNDLPQLIILFVVSFAAEIFFRYGKMKQITFCWLGICVGWLALCQIFRLNGMLLHVAWIPSAVSVIFISAVAINYMVAREEKDLVTETFGRYVDPVVMRELLNGGASPNLGGELKNIAVLFVDIRGFTSMSEELPPSTVVEILNRYLTLTTECIRRHHGTLDKFVGDCTMAFWNAPLRQDEPVLLACRAALDMLKGSETLGTELMERFGRKISFGVGVHWGSAVVGNIGTPFRMDYTAIGDTVNTAARLEANARGGTILISRVVADILGDRANVTSLGNSIKLKGKSADFEILVLNSLKE